MSSSMPGHSRMQGGGLDSMVNSSNVIESTSGASQVFLKPRKGRGGPRFDMAKRIVVAIDASKEITKNALEWALTNVAVQEGHCITLLALFPSGTSVWKVWGFSALWPLLGGDCGSRIGQVGSMGSRATQFEIEGEIQRACSTMMQDLHNLCAEKKAAGRDVTASEAKKLGATWVVLDRHLKREAKNCKEHLDCNIVLVKQSEPKILRLNLRHRGSYELPAQGLATPASSGEAQNGLSFLDLPKMTRNVVYLQSDCTTPSSSPDEIGASFTPSDQGISSNSSSETSNSPYASVDPHLYKHLAHVSSEMTVRGAILEAAAAELIEKGGTYTPSDSDSDDVSPLPGASPDPARCDLKLGKPYFDGRMMFCSENMRPNPGLSLKLSLQIIALTKHDTIGNRYEMALSRPTSRLASRTVSRRDSPAKSSHKASPEQPLTGSQCWSSDGRPSLSQREVSFSQSLGAMLQSNVEPSTPPPERGSLSELLKPGRGATGFLGGRLCSALVHSGHTVRVTMRANSVTSELPPEVEIANCDIQDAPALIKACEGCDAVIHTAALVGSWLPDSSQFITVNVQGLRNVIDAVKANPSVKKLVYTSSFFALGYTDGHIGDEDQVHPGKFISPYEESKFLADKVAQEAAAEGVPIVSVYPGMVYGPGKLTAGNSLALMLIGRFKGQSPGYIGNGADKFSFSHVDDVASGHLAAMEIGKGGGRYLLCGDNASYVEIYDLAASLTHTKPPSFHIPFWALELAGHITVMWAHFSFCTGISKSVPTLTSTAVQILKHEWAYSSAKAERELGYKSRPLKEGLSELLAWLKATGHITY